MKVANFILLLFLQFPILSYNHFQNYILKEMNITKQHQHVFATDKVCEYWLHTESKCWVNKHNLTIRSIYVCVCINMCMYTFYMYI